MKRLQMTGFSATPSCRARRAMAVAVVALVFASGGGWTPATAGLASNLDVFPISQGPSDSSADASYNSARGSWLIVWKEEREVFSGTVEVVMGNIVSIANDPQSGPFAISPPGENMSHPRVAFDTASGEWIVVWSGGIHPLTSKAQLRVRRVTPQAELVGTGPRLISGGDGVANPDILAGIDPEESLFALAWEEDVAGRRHIHVQAFVFADEQPTGTATLGPVVDLMDDEGSRDADGHQPRFAELVATTEVGPLPLITFRRDFEGFSEVVITEVIDGSSAGRHVAFVDPSASVSIAFNPVSKQAMVAFDSDLDSERSVYGMKFSWSNDHAAFLPTTIVPFPLTDGERPDVHTSLYDDAFLMSFDRSTSELAHVVGSRIVGRQAFAPAGDQLGLSIGSDGASLALWRESDEAGLRFNGTAVIDFDPLQNQPPVPILVAPETVEGGRTLVLSGLDSHDADGDPILFYWRISGAVNVLFEGPQPGEIELEAPLLKGDEPQEIFVELRVNDARVDPLEVPVAAASVTLLPFDLLAERFLRGDANGSGAVDLSDAISILNGLFVAGEEISCADAADGNDDGDVDLSDPIFVLNYLFVGGDDPPAPGASECGVDPSEDDLPQCGVNICILN